MEGHHLKAGGGHHADGLHRGGAALSHRLLVILAGFVGAGKQGIAPRQGEHLPIRQGGAQHIVARLQEVKLILVLVVHRERPGDAQLRVGQRQHKAAGAGFPRVHDPVHVLVKPGAAPEAAGFDAAHPQTDAGGQREGVGFPAVGFRWVDGVVKGGHLLPQGPDDIGAWHGGRDPEGAGAEVRDLGHAVLVGGGGGNHMGFPFRVKEHLDQHIPEEGLAAEPSAVHVLIPKGHHADVGAFGGGADVLLHRSPFQTEGGGFAASAGCGQHGAAGGIIGAKHQPLGEGGGEIIVPCRQLAELVGAVSPGDGGGKQLAAVPLHLVQGHLHVVHQALVGAGLAVQVDVNIGDARDGAGVGHGRQGQNHHQKHGQKQGFQGGRLVHDFLRSID